MHLCHACKQEIDLDPATPVSRRDECPGCYADLRCCLNCAHYDPGAHNSCRETMADYVTDREKGNFCGYFSFRASEHGDSSEVVAAKSKLDDLFKGLK